MEKPYVRPYLFSAQLQHALYRLNGLARYVGIHIHLRPLIFQSVVYLAQGVQLHEFALVARASHGALAHLRRNGIELLVRTAALQLVQYACLRGYYVLLVVVLHCVFQHHGR